jgi:hypothetical protein
MIFATTSPAYNAFFIPDLFELLPARRFVWKALYEID